VPLDPAAAGEDFCYLETTGRRTDKPHRVEMWFAADPDADRIYVLSGGRDRSDWVLNLRANSRVRVRIGGRTFAGEAREIEGTPGELRARQLVGGKYGYWQPGTELRGWARNSLPIAIDLEMAQLATAR
jgi:deazaflavin-dependent oxidoreductase (nitroreductase family)